MNIFAKIIKLSEFTYEKVNFYSIVLEDKEYCEENSEFYNFLEKVSENLQYEMDLSNLLVWIEEIGTNFGAKRKYFRHEGIDSDTAALPPQAKLQKHSEIIVNELRLYCLPANEHVVFLYNGGIKTTFEARECPNVGKYIKQANNITKNINELFGSEIQWNNNFTDIIYDKNLEFEI